MKFIFFDLGNVFMTYDLVFSTLKKDLALDNNFIKKYDKYDDDAMVGKLTIPNIWQKVCLELNMPQNSSYNLISSWVSDYRVIAPMHKLAREISQKYSVGVLSNMYHDFYKEIFTQKYVPNDIIFSPIIISAEVGYKKPDSKIYQIAEQKCGFSGSDIFFIDDKQENLDEAARQGWQTFLFDFKNPQESVDKLRSILL